MNEERIILNPRDYPSCNKPWSEERDSELMKELISELLADPKVINYMKKHGSTDEELQQWAKEMMWHDSTCRLPERPWTDFSRPWWTDIAE